MLRFPLALNTQAVQPWGFLSPTATGPRKGLHIGPREAGIQDSAQSRGSSKLLYEFPPRKHSSVLSIMIHSTPPLTGKAQVDNVAKAVIERKKFGDKGLAELDSAAGEMWAKLPSHYEWLKAWQNV